jgi:hypothetical protein
MSIFVFIGICVLFISFLLLKSARNTINDPNCPNKSTEIMKNPKKPGKYSEILKKYFSPRPNKLLQSTPKVSVKPLKSFKSSSENYPIIETPLHKTKTLIIDCNQDLRPKPNLASYTLDYTPNLSSRLYN